MALNQDHKDVNESALSRHNELRKLHSSPALSIDWALAKSAQAYAEKLAKTNTFAHSKSEGKYGENLASSFNSVAGYVFSGAQATQNWYDEIKDYHFGKEEQQIGKIGHFSQVVWKGSTTAGFGRAKTAKGMFIIVGQYKPPGNFIGNFKENVQSPSGKPSKLPSTTPASPTGAAPRSSTFEVKKTTTSGLRNIFSKHDKDTSPSTTSTKVITTTTSTTTTRSSNSNNNNNSQHTIGPKSSNDVLIEKSTKTVSENGKIVTEIKEVYRTPKGITYERKIKKK